MDLLLKNIGLLATPLGNVARKGAEQGGISLIPDAMIGIKDGKIAHVSSSAGSMSMNASSTGLPSTGSPSISSSSTTSPLPVSSQTILWVVGKANISLVI